MTVVWTLAERRAVDGAERYESDKDEVMWFTGIERSGKPVGTKGDMEYRTSPSSGLYVFHACNHDEWVYWCGACGKPTMYENLCYNCGEVNTAQCVDCEEEFDVN
jgi:hypothetical protein